MAALRRKSTIGIGWHALALSAALPLLGCSTTVPVAVIGQHGEIMRGSNTFGLSGGSFSVTNGKLTCTGT
jgi:hypothetical protein